MKKPIRDIIKESLLKEALSASPKTTLEELERALIPYHEKLMSQAEKNMQKAKSEGDVSAHDEALKVYEKELGILVRLQEKKLSLMKQILSDTNKEAIDAISY